MLTGILVVFHVMACLTLILVILLQVGRGHGLTGASFTQGGVQTIFGTRAAEFLSKATTVMAIVFVMTCISLDVLQVRKSRSLFATGTKAPVKQADLEKIREALEKLQAEEAAKAGAKQGTEEAAKTSAPAAPAETQAEKTETSPEKTQDQSRVPEPAPTTAKGG